MSNNNNLLDNDQLRPYVAKTTQSIVFGQDDNERDRIALFFKDGTRLDMYDDGQSCCEVRYITTGHDLKIEPAGLLSIELRNVIALSNASEEHEIVFLHVITDRETIVFETHNEHNGYYGGFNVRIEEIQ